MINCIVAVERNQGIGFNGQMPWPHLKGDMSWFRSITSNNIIIMGRKTWDSIPAKFRPLPGRDNWVITRQRDWHAPGAIVAHSLTEVMHRMPPDAQPWIMGGGEIYAQALPLATHAVITEIDLVIDDGDTFAPELGSEWSEVSRESHVSAHGLAFDFVRLQKT